VKYDPAVAIIERYKTVVEKEGSKVKEALQYILGRLKDQRPVTHKVGNTDYAVGSDGTLGDPVRDLAPQWTKPAVEVSSLSGLAAALKGGIDEIKPAEVFVHVSDPWTVRVASLAADDYGKRHVWVVAKHVNDSGFAFDNYYKPEDFIIKFRASFLYNDEAAKVQLLCSSLGSGSEVLVADDGISQEITVKSGTVTRSSQHLPADGISLVPWRTFRDANPVMSKFLLRMKGVKDSLPLIALFEIDAQWKRETVNSVAKYLTESLPGFTIIA
jgi:hypothetical protein